VDLADESDEEPLVDPKAVEPIRRMVRTLTSAERISYTVEQEYDAIQSDGEALEFGARTEETVRRPDHARVERWDRSGRHLQAFYDGKTVTVYDGAHDVYATAARTGSLDQLNDFLRDDVGLKLPLGDLLDEDLGAILLDHVIAARFADVQTIGGFECDHVALRTEEGAGIQLWIRRGEPALPQRIAINFETARGRPQFRATFTEWDLSPRTPDGLFEFEPAKDAKQVPFVLPSRRAAAAGAQEDAR
jgi:hypothetical protein